MPARVPTLAAMNICYNCLKGAAVNAGFVVGCFYLCVACEEKHGLPPFVPEMQIVASEQFNNHRPEFEGEKEIAVRPVPSISTGTAPLPPRARSQWSSFGFPESNFVDFAQRGYLNTITPSSYSTAST